MPPPTSLPITAYSSAKTSNILSSVRCASSFDFSYYGTRIPFPLEILTRRQHRRHQRSGRRS